MIFRVSVRLAKNFNFGKLNIAEMGGTLRIASPFLCFVMEEIQKTTYARCGKEMLI